MTPEKQIEDMQNTLIQISKQPIMIEGLEHWSDVIAEELYAAGYRKATDVAREIFAEIDNALHHMAVEYHNAGHPEYFAVCEMVYHKVLRRIEKKYTEVENNG